MELAYCDRDTESEWLCQDSCFSRLEICFEAREEGVLAHTRINCERMKRLRGRRMTLLLASALPLLAEKDDAATATTRIAVQDESSRIRRSLHPLLKPKEPPPAQENIEEESSSSTTATTTWSTSLAVASPSEMTMAWNVVIPLRPYTPSSQQQQELCSNASLTAASEDTTEETTIDEERRIKDSDDATTTTTTTTQEKSDEAATEKITKDEAATVEKTTTPEVDDDTAQQQQQQQPAVVVDYASKSAGALVLEKSPNFEGTSNLLAGNKDQYAIVPCREPNKSVVIGLSEDILVKQVVLANYERYSSHVREFRLQGSTTAVSSREWMDLGSFTAQPHQARQSFDLPSPSWARYLKFHFVSHYGNEHYCTISQISVHGSTVLQGFHEQWEEESKEEEAGDDDEGVSVTEETVEENRGDEEDSDESDQIAIDDALGAETTPTTPATCMDDFVKRLASKKVAGGALSRASIPSQARTRVQSKSSRHHKLSSMALVRPATPRGSWRLVTSKTAPMDVVASSKRVSDSPVVKQIQTLLKMKTGLDLQVDDKMRRLARVDDNEDEAVIQQEDDGESESSSLASVQQQHTAPGKETFSNKGSTSIENTTTAGTREKNVPEEIAAEKPEVVVSDGTVNRKETAVDNPTTATVDSSSVAAAKRELMHETDLVLAKLLQRLESAACLKELNFAAFKAKNLNTGTSGSTPAGGTTMEPIFKKLTDNIKAMQANVAVHDMYATESIVCYQRIILELITEMESFRVEQDARISELERKSDWTEQLLSLAFHGMESIKLFYERVKPHLVEAGLSFGMLLASVSQEVTYHDLIELVMALAAIYVGYGFLYRVLFGGPHLSSLSKVKRPSESTRHGIENGESEDAILEVDSLSTPITDRLQREPSPSCPGTPSLIPD